MDTSDYKASAHAFALAKGIFPILDEPFDWLGADQEIGCLDESASEYDASAVQMGMLHKFLVERWREGKPYSYYALENRLKSHPFTNTLSRGAAICGCRYLYLHGLFDSAFWMRLCARGESPVEAALIMSDSW